MKIGIYCRVSSLSQKEFGESLETQRVNGINFCKEKDFDYKIYDEGSRSGGSIKDRLVYQQLVNDVEKNKIDGIWVTMLSRVNRNTLESLLLFKLCVENEVELFVGDTKYNLDDPQIRLQLTVLSSFDEYNREVIGLQSVINKKRLLEDGYYINSSVPFGYDVVDRKIIPNKEEGDLLNQILDWYIDGYSQKRIVNELKLNYPNGVGGREYKWNTQWVRKFLKRDYFVSGEFITSLKDDEYKFKIEPIVSKDKWLKAKSVFGSNQKHLREEQISWLEGKVGCSQCGGNITLGVAYGWKKKDGTQKKYYYWSCRNTTELHKTKHWSIKKKDLEDDLLLFVNRYLLNKEWLKEELKDIISEEYKSNTEIQNIEIDRNKLLDDREKVELKLDRAKRLYINLEISEEEYKGYKKDYEVELRKIDDILYSQKGNVEVLDRFVEEWINDFGSIDNLTATQFLDKFVERINIRLIKRSYFKEGRLIKYSFVFKNRKLDWRNIEKEVFNRKKNKYNLSSLSNSNTSKVIIDERCGFVELDFEMNGFGVFNICGRILVF